MDLKGRKSGKRNFLEKYIKKYWKPFCAAIACLTVEALCDLMQPTIMARIVDVGVAEKKLDFVLHMGGVMLGVTALGALAACSRNIIATHVSQNFGAALRLDLYKKIQGFSLEDLNKFESASLVTRLTNDVTQVQNFTNGLMRIFVKAPILCIGSLIMAARLNSYLAWILVIVVPVVAMLISFSMRTGYPYFVKIQKRLDGVNGVMREYLAGIRVVKAFNRFKYEKFRFEKANQELADVSITAMRVMAAFTPSITLTVNIGIVVVLWLGGIRVNSGNLHVGQIIAFINYMTQILFSLMMISFVFMMFVRARASLERIGEIMAAESSMHTEKSSSKAYEEAGKVEFQGVNFSYEESAEETILKEISFACLPGQTVGIIGSTGAGKSSLVNLIPRFYDVKKGVVKVNGVDVREMDIQELREKISIVPQKTMLFTGTILENIKWGKEDAAIEEVEAALKVAEAQEFVHSFPEGLHTLLGQGGINLSGGQKQRLSIARALVRKPQILILDDCTSAVDMATEGAIRGKLKEFIEGLTCIIIAQRITSVMNADFIVVLENGKIAGMGKHEDLMENCPIYIDIFESQIGKGMV